MADYINEIKFKFDQNIPNNIVTKIREQKRQCICKLVNDDNQFGTGFFCKIHYENFDKKVLITHSSLQLNEKLRNLDKIPLKNSLKKDLNINTLNKIIFTDEENEITFIEIKDNEIVDDNQFLELDENIFNENPEEHFKDQFIYLLFKSSSSSEQRFGKIKQINNQNSTIEHLCSSEEGSLGGPIINYTNQKVIGMNKGFGEDKEWNLATFLNKPIENFCIFCENYEENKKILKTCRTESDLTTTESSLNSSLVKEEVKRSSKRSLTNKPLINIDFMVDNGKNIPIACSIDMAFKDVANIFLNTYGLGEVKNIIFVYNEQKIDRNDKRTLKELNLKDKKSIFVYYETIKDLSFH